MKKYSNKKSRYQWNSEYSGYKKLSNPYKELILELGKNDNYYVGMYTDMWGNIDPIVLATALTPSAYYTKNLIVNRKPSYICFPTEGLTIYKSVKFTKR